MFLERNPHYQVGSKFGDTTTQLRKLSQTKLGNDAKNEFLHQFLFFIATVENDEQLEKLFMDETSNFKVLSQVVSREVSRMVPTEVLIKYP